MKIIKTKFKGLKIIKSKIFYDKRGYFREIAKKKILNNNFLFDCM
jgi:dTDP-4-dehydrorhamnose 3,5-epimerase